MEGGLDWGSVPMWLNTIVTAVVGGVAVTSYNLNARTRQEELLERRQHQANLISVWIAGGGTITFRNGSDAPVFDVVASSTNVLGGGRPAERNGLINGRATLTELPPNETKTVNVFGWGGGAMGRREGYELAFTDAKGVHWVRPARRRLLEIDVRPQEYYGFSAPYPW